MGAHVDLATHSWVHVHGMVYFRRMESLLNVGLVGLLLHSSTPHRVHHYCSRLQTWQRRQKKQQNWQVNFTLILNSLFYLLSMNDTQNTNGAAEIGHINS